MKRAVRTGVPVRVTSTTSTTPRPMLTSTRRPALVAMISPHAPAATPVHALMAIDVFVPLLTYGAAFAIPVAAAS